MRERIIIIGAGQAGLQAAASLRQEGFQGAIALIGEEPDPPYQRPPLSKAYLKGALGLDRLFLRPAAFFEQAAIDLIAGVRAVAIERTAGVVALSDGRRLGYDRLLLATGAPARRLDCPGAKLAGVHTLRTRADSNALRTALAPSAAPFLIVGAGYIGLEVAAILRAAGRRVIIVEAAARPLARVAGAPFAAAIETRHRARRVDFRFGASLAALEGRTHVEAALLSDGERIACDGALIAIGAAPAVDLARAAGLAVDNGILVDDATHTSDPLIAAAGDCANFPSALFGRRLRLESAPNAIDQAKVAAATLAGREAQYDPTPWFWSDQYEFKIQSAGLAQGADAEILRGDPAAGAFSVWSFLDGRLIAVDAVDDPAAFQTARRLIAAKARPDPKLLADPAQDLKSLAV